MSIILSVEDNTDNQELLKWIFETTDHELVLAYNAEDGLDILSKQAIDVVLMDINLPNMQGDEATRQIRRNNKTANLPVIALTAHALTDEVENIKASGVDYVLTKPVDEAELLHLVDKITQDKSQT